MSTQQKSSWDIATEWYRESDIAHSIQQTRSITHDGEKIPNDIYSPEFAKWLTDQYRLAMNKGIQLARENPRPNGCQKCGETFVCGKCGYLH